MTPGRRPVASALALLACCRAEPAPQPTAASVASAPPPLASPAAASSASASAWLLAPSPPYAEPPEAQALRLGRCAALRPDPQRPGYHAARCAERDVLLLLATREDPQRFRPAAALYRLDQALGLGVVPATTVREIPLAELLEAVPEAERPKLAQALAVKTDGRVSASLTELPAGTRIRATRWSNEEQLWMKLVEADEAPGPGSASAAESWTAMLVLDYLSANFLRRTVEQDEQGRLWLVDNQTAFVEHPEQYGLDQLLARLKRCRRPPPALAERLTRLDEPRLDALLRAGPYEAWLVHPRPVRELAIRTRALASWLRARNGSP